MTTRQIPGERCALNSPAPQGRRRAFARPGPNRSIAVSVAVAAAVMALVAIVVGTWSFTGPARAQTAPTFTLSVTPTQDLTNGQSMTVTVTRTAAGTSQGLQMKALSTGWCTADVQLPPNPTPWNPTTFSALPPPAHKGVHCTTGTHPLSDTYRSQTQYSPLVNSSGDYSTLSATIPAESSGGSTLATGFTLICDSGHPCTFVVLVSVYKTGTTQPAVYLTVPVTYAPPSIDAACGGAAPGQVTSLSPDRLGQQITNWTLAACSSGLGGGKAVTQNLASNQSDASALSSFADGDSDLAYSSVGYGATPAFTPPVQRPYVAVPIALNAVVLAHVQSKHVTNVLGSRYVFGKLPQLYVTDAQAAQMIGGGPTRTSVLWSSTLGKALVFDNPTLGPPSLYYTAALAVTLDTTPSATVTGVVGSSQQDGTTLFATTFLHTVAPHALVSRTGKPLGVTSDFGTTQPAYSVVASTGSLLLAKALSPGIGNGWALTDAATAANTWGGLSVAALQTPGSIGSGSATFVAPTGASMQAAVSEMIPQSDGTLIPNSDATTSGSVTPYALTYVEYAFAPAQPLLNQNCSPQTKTEQNLIDWLNYITGAGQSGLDAGLAPLTPALQHQARQAIAEVGKMPTTGPCASVAAPAAGASGGSTSTPASGTAGTPGATAATAANGTLGTSAFSSGANGALGTSAAATTTSQLGSTAKTGASGGRTTRQVAVDLAGFKHYWVSSLILPVLGVLFLLVFLPGLALLVADGPQRARLARVVQRGDDGPPASLGDP